MSEVDRSGPYSTHKRWYLHWFSFKIWRNWQTKAPAAPQHLESVHDFEAGAAAAEAHLRMPGEELGGGTKLGMFWKVSTTTFVWNALLLQDLEVSNTSMRTSVTFSNPERVSTSWNDLNYMTYVHIVSLFLSHWKLWQWNPTCLRATPARPCAGLVALHFCCDVQLRPVFRQCGLPKKKGSWRLLNEDEKGKTDKNDKTI